MPPSFGSPGTFPNDSTIGAPKLFYREGEPDVDAVTDRNEFEDGGVSFLLRNTTAPKTWELMWDGLTETQANVITAHYNNAFKVYTFDFVDRASETQSGVRYLEYKRTHTKQWSQRVEVTLIKYPS